MSLKKWINIFRKNRTPKIQIEFRLNAQGRFETEIAMTKSIPVTVAQRSIDKLKHDLTAGLTKRVNEAGYQRNIAGKGQFIRSQTIGDILK